MSSRTLTEADAAGVRPLDLQRYARAKGWERVHNNLTDIAVFRRPENAKEEIVVPQDTDFADFHARIVDAIRAFAEYEKRSAAAVLGDVVAPESDVLRFGLSAPRVEGGTVPLGEGVGLLMGARKAILAAACTVIRPERFHPRMSLREAESFVASCRMGQTEHGSFVLKFICPLSGDTVAGSDQPLLYVPHENGKSFGRRVTATLMESVAQLIDAIRDDAPERVLDQDGGTGPVVSANLCEALSEMQPDADGAAVTIAAGWSQLIPAPSSVPAKVRLPREYVPIVEHLAKELRTQGPPKPDTFFAIVDELKGEPGPDGRMEGEVVLGLVLESDLLIKAKAFLDAESYQKAWTAHNPLQIVRLRGILSRGTRLSKLTDVEEFEVWSPRQQSGGGRAPNAGAVVEPG